MDRFEALRTFVAVADHQSFAEAALDELDDAERSLRGEDAEPRGELIVTAPRREGCESHRRRQAVLSPVWTIRHLSR